MVRVLDAAANRLAPWREADWRVLIGPLTVTSWLVMGSGIMVVAVGVVRQMRSSDPSSGSLPAELSHRPSGGRDNQT